MASSNVFVVLWGAFLNTNMVVYPAFYTDRLLSSSTHVLYGQVSLGSTLPFVSWLL